MAVESDEILEKSQQGNAGTSADEPQSASSETTTSDEPKVQKPEIDFKTALYIRELEKKVSEYETKISDVRDYVKKMESEIEQIRLRTQRDFQKNLDKTSSDFFAMILPVVDDLERSLKSVKAAGDPFVEGVRMIHQTMTEILKRSGLSKIEAVGTIFDPSIHEALTAIPVQSIDDDGRVVDEVKSGYKFKELVVRPSQVIVGKKSEAEGHATENDQA